MQLELALCCFRASNGARLVRLASMYSKWRALFNNARMSVSAKTWPFHSAKTAFDLSLFCLSPPLPTDLPIPVSGPNCVNSSHYLLFKQRASDESFLQKDIISSVPSGKYFVDTSPLAMDQKASGNNSLILFLLNYTTAECLLIFMFTLFAR